MRLFKNKICLIAALVLCITLVLSMSFVSAEEEVVVEEYKNPSLTFQKIHELDPEYGRGNPYVSNGVYEENPDANEYTIKTNAWSAWFSRDRVDFAYKKMNFCYGAQGTLVIDATLKSHNGSLQNVTIGIMLRTSLAAGATNVFFHHRTGETMVQYRPADNQATIRGKTLSAPPIIPSYLRVVLQNKKATCYYKSSKNDEYVKYATVPFICGSEVYAGVAVATSSEDHTVTAKFSDINMSILTPPGAQPVTSEDGGGGDDDTTSDATSSEDEIKLPPDEPVEGEILMRETFTDGDMQPAEEKYPENPRWNFNELYGPGLITTEDHTNRYIYDWMEMSRYYYAGDQHWSDYTMTMDITFTDEYSIDETNEFYVYVRNTDIQEYGVQNYAICFTNRNKVFIGTRFGGVYDIKPTAVTTAGADDDIISRTYDYLADAESNKTKQLKIRAFDNVITVWLDGELLLKYTDVSTEVNGFGGIGWMTCDAAVRIDNILVVKEVDLLGGDFDNTICGNWDEPKAELYQHFDSNSWL